jgi:hypothetical protein
MRQRNVGPQGRSSNQSSGRQGRSSNKAKAWLLHQSNCANSAINMTEPSHQCGSNKADNTTKINPYQTDAFDGNRQMLRPCQEDLSSTVKEAVPSVWMMEASKQRQLWILRASQHRQLQLWFVPPTSAAGNGSAAGGVCSCHPSTLSQTSHEHFVSFPYPFVLFSGFIFPVEWGAI